jgi:hypothetical protein
MSEQPSSLTPWDDCITASEFVVRILRVVSCLVCFADIHGQVFPVGFFLFVRANILILNHCKECSNLCVLIFFL